MPENSNNNKKARLLIVEDEGIIAMDLSQEMVVLGYEVCGPAMDGEEALEITEREHPDLVLMDIVLPGELDGIRTAEMIREKYQIPVVFVSAYADQARLERAKLAYPFGYILKPFQPRELAVTVEMALFISRMELERRGVEEALRISENKFRKLFIEMINGFALHEILCDGAGRAVDYVTLEVNPAYESLLHMARENVVGKKASQLLTPEELKHWLGIFGPVALTGQSTSYELYSPQNRKTFEGSAYCPEQGKFAVTFRDISESKLAEEALHDREKRLREFNQLLAAVLEHTHMMAVYLDAQFNFIWVNRAYAETCRHAPDFFPGRNHFELYPHEENQAIFQKVAETGEPFYIAAKPFIFPDQPERGTTYWDWSLIPVKGDHDRVTGLVFTLAEVTDRIRTLEALRESEQRLRLMVELKKEVNALLRKSGEKEKYRIEA